MHRRERAFRITGLTWRGAPLGSQRASASGAQYAWLGRNRRFSKDDEFKAQTMIDGAAIRLMLNRIAPK